MIFRVRKFEHKILLTEASQDHDCNHIKSSISFGCWYFTICFKLRELQRKFNFRSLASSVIDRVINEYGGNKKRKYIFSDLSVNSIIYKIHQTLKSEKMYYIDMKSEILINKFG